MCFLVRSSLYGGKVFRVRGSQAQPSQRRLYEKEVASFNRPKTAVSVRQQRLGMLRVSTLDRVDPSRSS